MSQDTKNSGRRENVTRPLLTQAYVERIARPRRGYAFQWDRTLTGLGVRISERGEKVWVVDYTVGIKRHRVTLGIYPEFDEQAARARANEVRAAARKGEQLPDFAPRERRTGAVSYGPATLGERCEEWLATKRDEGKATVETDEKAIRNYILKYLGGGSRLMSAVKPEHVEAMHRAITKGGVYGNPAPVRANRVLSLATAIFNRAWRRGVIPSNPCLDVKKNFEQPREKNLKKAQALALREAIEAYADPVVRDAILLVMACGTRKSETLMAEFDEFRPLDDADPDEGDDMSLWWHIPASHAKARKDHLVPLNAAALEVLERRLAARVDDCPYLFPSYGDTGHLVAVRKAWRLICQTAGVEDFHVHDLRHYFTASARRAGVPDTVIRDLLGHASVNMTAQYGRGDVNHSGLKEASERIAARLPRKAALMTGSDDDGSVALC